MRGSEEAKKKQMLLLKGVLVDMVRSQQWQNKKLFLCESCGFGYTEEKIAKQCEEFCTKHNGCDPKITKFAIKRAL